MAFIARRQKPSLAKGTLTIHHRLGLSIRYGLSDTILEVYDCSQWDEFKGHSRPIL